MKINPAYGVPPWVAVLLYIPAYLFMDWASHVEPQAMLGIAPWDPPAGLSFALLLTYGLGMAPAVAIAAIVGELLMRALPGPPQFTVLTALVMTIGYCGAAVVLRGMIRIDPRLRSLPDLTWLTGVVVASALGVALGFVGLYTLLREDISEDLFRTVLHFWIGDVSGILAVTPFILVYGPRLRQGFRMWIPTPAMLAEAAALVLAIWIVFGLESTDDFRFFYLLFVPVIWIAMRHGIEGATVAVLGVQLGLIAGVGYRGRAAGTVLELQLLMLVLGMTGLFLGMVVTERRGALGALNDRESELNRMLRLAGAGEMASALAHELNQPLTAITAYLRACRTMLQSPGGREEQIAETMDKAVQEAGRAAEVVRRLRDYFGTGVVRLEPCAAGELVRAAAEPLRARLDRAGVALEMDCPATLPKVLADRLQLEIVLHNLLGNAVDAVAGTEETRRQVLVSAATEDNMLRIRVADTGPGLAPEIQERLFQPFATSKPQGMGLGLAISRSIVEAHYGNLWYEPSPAGGAIFNLMLPIHAPSGPTRP